MKGIYVSAVFRKAKKEKHKQEAVSSVCPRTKIGS